jgi:ribulose-phosphate 3-epimerase
VEASADSRREQHRETLRQRLIAPSILSADFGRLDREIAAIMEAGARLIHVDVMDGHFVPNITIGPPVVAAIAPLIHERGGIVDCHLMIAEPERYIERFAEAGADLVTVHTEACVHLHRVVAQIHDAGALAAVALNPATPVSALEEIDPYVDMVLVMSVNPGFGGQSFIPTSLAKVARVRRDLPDEVALQVDGGVTDENLGALIEAGANLFVAGNSVFGKSEPGRAFLELAALAAGRV